MNQYPKFDIWVLPFVLWKAMVYEDVNCGNTKRVSLFQHLPSVTL